MKCELIFREPKAGLILVPGSPFLTVAEVNGQIRSTNPQSAGYEWYTIYELTLPPLKKDDFLSGLGQCQIANQLGYNSQFMTHISLGEQNPPLTTHMHSSAIELSDDNGTNVDAQDHYFQATKPFMHTMAEDMTAPRIFMRAHTGSTASNGAWTPVSKPGYGRLTCAIFRKS